MRAKLVLSVLFSIGIITGISAQNTHMMVPSSSIAYEYLRVISASVGDVPALVERPASQARFLEVLDQVEYNALSPAMKGLYRELLQLISPSAFYTREQGLAIDISPAINLEGYLETNRNQLDWYRADANRKAFLTLPLEGWFFDSLYVRSEFPIKKEPFIYQQYPHHWGNFSNVPANMSQIDYQYPPVAYLSMGGEHWNLHVGRDRLDYGSGRSGNFLLTDTVPYYNFVRAQTNWEAFSFFYTAIDLEPWATGFDNIAADGSLKDPGETIQRALFSHGFMLNFIPGLRLTLKESALLAGTAPTISYVNPLILFHNWYERQANSFMTVDAELNLMPGLNLYGVFALDQLQTFFEVQRYNATAIPNAYGYLLGSEYSWSASEGYWRAHAEWVYTNPWLYIHEKSNATLIWTGRIVSNIEGTFYRHLPLGYPTGPDSRNLYVSIGYSAPAAFRVFGGYSFQEKGEHNVVETQYEESREAASLRTPTGDVVRTHTLWAEAAWYPDSLWPLGQVEELGASAALVLQQYPQIVYDLQFSLYVSLEF